MKKLLILLGLVGLSSCMSFSDRSMRPVRDSIARQLPEIRLEKEFAVSLGSGMLILSRFYCVRAKLMAAHASTLLSM